MGRCDRSSARESTRGIESACTRQVLWAAACAQPSRDAVPLVQHHGRHPPVLAAYRVLRWLAKMRPDCGPDRQPGRQTLNVAHALEGEARAGINVQLADNSESSAALKAPRDQFCAWRCTEPRHVRVDRAAYIYRSISIFRVRRSASCGQVKLSAHVRQAVARPNTNTLHTTRLRNI